MSRIIPIAIFIMLVTAASTAQNSNVAVVAPVVPDPAKSTVRARVFYEDTGRPVRRTSVMLVTAKSGPGREGSGVTDGQGIVEIKNLRAGKYYAIVNAPGVVSPMAYLNINIPDPETLPDMLAPFPFIEVNGVSNVVAEIPAKQGGSISGRITYSNGDPAIGVKVEILRKVGDQMMPVLSNMSAMSSMLSGGAGVYQTDDRGWYRFAGLPAGEYYVRVSENIVHATSKSHAYYDSVEYLMLAGTASLVTLFFPDAFDKAKAQTVPVLFGQEVPEVNLVIPDRPLHSLSGKVVASKDKLPVRKARVTLKAPVVDGGAERPDAPPQERNITYTDDEGKWQFNELPQGKFMVVVQTDDSSFDAVDRAYGKKEPDESNLYASNAANTMANAMSYASNIGRQVAARKLIKKFAPIEQEFAIEDKDLADQTIELKFGSRVTGKVTMDGGADMPRYVTISLNNIQMRSSATGSISNFAAMDDDDSPTRPNAKDEFEIESVPAGLTELTITSGGQDFYVKKATSGGVDLLKAPLDVKEGDDSLYLQIVLSADMGTLKGTVVDGQKDPLANLLLTFTPTDPGRYRNASFYRTVRTGNNGEFELDLPPFEYSLVYPPTGMSIRSGKPFVDWLAGNMKQAQTFKIAAGETTKATIKREKEPPK